MSDVKKNNVIVYSLLMLTVFAATVIYWLAFIFFSDIKEIIFITPDDASYYLKIAVNYSAGNGMSFDGIHETTGFQPLWEYILIIVVFAANTSPENYLRIIMCIQILLLCAAAYFFYKSLVKFYMPKVLLSGSIFFLVFVFSKSINSMETALLVFMISILFFFSVKKNIFLNYDLKNEFLFGVLSGLLMLTRLDMVFLFIPLQIYLLLKIFKNPDSNVSFLRFLNLNAGPAIILLPYFFYNYFSSGNFIPISGFLKSAFPEITNSENFFEILKYRETYFAATAPLYIIWLMFKNKNGNMSPEYFYLIIMEFFAYGIILLFLYLVFFMKWVLFPWYFITFSVFVSMLICIVADYVLTSENIFKKAIFWSVIIFIFVYYNYKTISFNAKNFHSLGNSWGIESYNAALWAKNNTNESDIFAMKDAGHFSLFSERKVISLDGLVNNFEYQEVIKNKNLNEYLKKNNVKYLVQHAVQDKEVLNGNYSELDLNYVSHRYSVMSDTIVVHKKNELYRSEPYDENDATVFIIWKIN